MKTTINIKIDIKARFKSKKLMAVVVTALLGPCLVQNRAASPASTVDHSRPAQRLVQILNGPHLSSQLGNDTC